MYAVQYVLKMSFYEQRNINGTEFMLEHGGEIKSSTPNALRAEEQRVQSLVSCKTNKLFDVLCVGHLHSFSETETTRGRVIVNGSFVGGDMYSLPKLKANSRPTQTLMGVHPKNGITWQYKIDLEKPRS